MWSLDPLARPRTPPRRALAYFQRGLTIIRPWLPVHLQILVVYASPALVAAYLSVTHKGPALWFQATRFTLPLITAVMGTVVVMVSVSQQARGQPISLGRASLKALPWVPRYAWTNAHTSAIFWVPVGLLLQARALQESMAPLAGTARPLAAAAWWAVIGMVALGLHTRTLLAPFFAIHGDLPGTMAALEAWRLSGRNFFLCLSTLVVASLPAILLLAIVSIALIVWLSALPIFYAAAEDLVWVAIQALRPLLIPAVYLLYCDLWAAEMARRRREGEPSVPGLARLLLAITRPLPHLPRLLSGEGERR